MLKKRKNVSYPGSYVEDEGKRSLISKIVGPLLNFFYFLRILRIREITKEGSRILDYGAGSGKLVELLVKRGYKAVGYEPSGGAVKVARKRGLKLTDRTSKLRGKFELIMFWHSLEHIDAQKETIDKAKKMLTKKGKILIAVPNADSFEARFFKEKWFHYTYPLHKVHFTPASLKKLLKAAHLKAKEIDYVNPEYTVSGLVQSFLNLILPENTLYGVVSHRRIGKSKSTAIRLALVSILVLIFLSPVILTFYLLELIFKKTGAIVLVGSK